MTAGVEKSLVSGDGLRGRVGWLLRSVQSAMRAALMAQAVVAVVGVGVVLLGSVAGLDLV